MRRIKQINLVRSAKINAKDNPMGNPGFDPMMDFAIITAHKVLAEQSSNNAAAGNIVAALKQKYE